jgi:hypothetical protein
LIETDEKMHVFLKRIYEEEEKNIEATARHTFMSLDAVKHFLGL